MEVPCMSSCPDSAGWCPDEKRRREKLLGGGVQPQTGAPGAPKTGGARRLRRSLWKEHGPASTSSSDFPSPEQRENKFCCSGLQVSDN